MNGVAYQTKELELASFLNVRGHRVVSARLDGNVVAFDFNGDAAPHVELRAPALTPERKSVLCRPAQHGAITANSFWGQGRSPWLLAVRVAPL